MTAFCAFADKGKFCGHSNDEEDKFALDGILYPSCDTNSIPSAYEEVDVELDDNGELFATVMVAGVKDARLLSSHDTALSADGINNTLAPDVAWWMYVKNSADEKGDSDDSEGFDQ